MTKTAAPKPTYVTIDGEEYETLTVEDRGKTFVVREISAEENHKNETAATDKDGKFNWHLNMLLSLATAIVEPDLTVDDIGKWPSRRYVRISRAFNKLNLVGPETDPNDLGQSGSPDSMSPTSGESSPAT